MFVPLSPASWPLRSTIPFPPTSSLDKPRPTIEIDRQRPPSALLSCLARLPPVPRPRTEKQQKKNPTKLAVPEEFFGPFEPKVGKQS